MGQPGVRLGAEGGEGLLVGSVDGALGGGATRGGGTSGAGSTAGCTATTASAAGGTVTTGRAVGALGARRALLTGGGSELAVDLDRDLLLPRSTGLGGRSLLLKIG